MTTYLLAGGGTAGHVNPLLATADALRARHPEARILVLGTKEGLESRLVPEHGYELLTIDKVPFPRRPNRAALEFPGRFRRAVRRVREIIAEHGVDAVVGFGGYAATPAYVAARGRVPVVIHEANAMPGLANKLGARWAAAVGVVFPNTPLRGAVTVGMPLRRAIADLDRAAARPEAIEFFGLDPARRTLLVTGGSLGAKRVNDAVRAVGAEITGAEHGGESWQVLHIVGRLSPFEDPRLPSYHVVEYCDRMDLALAAADLVLSRAGASTVAELSALGLPAVYVPYAVGNGEQTKNIAAVLDAGGAELLPDAQCTPQRLREQLLPLLADAGRRERMGELAAAQGRLDAAEVLAAMIDEAIAAER